MTFRADLVTAWAHGWTITRESSAPQPLQLGGTDALEVPTPIEDRRIVVPDPTQGSVRAALADLSDSSDACLRFPGDDDDWQLLREPGWDLLEPSWFMHRPVMRRTIGDEAEGCETVVVDHSEDLVTVEIWAASGVEGQREIVSHGRLGAARGSATVPENLTAWGTVDQIWTLPEHRQRGLGRRVMLELENAAQERGVTDLVLTSSPMGLMLYDSCGWSEISRCVWAVNSI
jgi:GNAT superfamily N-acetyltransferase